MYDDAKKTLDPHYHTVALLVHDEPGVLARIANLFLKRNFNISTITVGSSTIPDVSRITISFQGDDKIYEQIVKQLNKLIDVIKVSDLPKETSIFRDLALIKIRTDDVEVQNKVMNYCNAYRARIVNITPEEVIVEMVGKPDKIDAFLQLVKNNLKEIARTGITAMSRSTINFEAVKKKKDKNAPE